MRSFPQPTNQKQLRSFLGLVAYYRKFIRGFALIAKPLHLLLREDTAWNWSDECTRAFDNLVQEVCENVTLEFPDFEAAKNDPSRALVIQTDASRLGIAGILGQLDGKGKPRPIFFVSRTCNDSESRYPATELEALALRFVVHKVSPFIIGLQAIVETDHSALVQLFNNPKEGGSARINKWRLVPSSTS